MPAERPPAPLLSGSRRWLPALLLPPLLAACGSHDASSAPPAARAQGSPPPDSAGPADGAVFTDVAAETGLDFVHFNGMSGAYYMAEVTGPGGALFDGDGDGDLDVYLVQGTMLGPGKTVADALFPPRHPEPPTGRLYRNELVPEGTLRFTDVTDAAGDLGTGYGMGVAAGDYDGDGRVDLYLTNFASNQLLHNEGGLRFRDVTAESGTDDPRWSVPAVFLDYDRDGRLDLYVGNYIAADLENRQICRDFVGAQDYCGPGAYPPHPDRLFRNRGDGTFEDVTARAGLARKAGAALGAVAADFDGDGRLDLYVANDSQPNFLWLQQPDGTFREEGLLSGSSVNAAGKAEASMGLDAGDVDQDGDWDLFMTHLTGESNTLFRNDGGGIFDDATATTGLGPPSLPYTSFGTGFFDYDHDGLLDLVIANGAVKKIEALVRDGDRFPLHQPNQLFRGVGGGRFVDVTAAAGPVFALSEVSRGIAFGDVDEDGDTDVLLVNNNGPARLLLNRVGQDRPWLGVRATTGEPPRDALGARVAVDRVGAPTLWGRVGTDRSFASAQDPRVRFGLGDAAEVRRVRVDWVDGVSESFDVPCTRCYVELRQGRGTPLGEDAT